MVDAVDNLTRSGARPLTAFNARGLPVAQIVETFVEPTQFERLRRPVNSLLSGPRGSGKTTMMKMLQPMALELWRSEKAVAISDEIPYTGVFVATDRAWKRQLEPPVGANPFGPEIALVAEAAFTTHVLRELVSAMMYRLTDPSIGIVRRSRAALPDVAVGRRLASALGRLVGLDSYEPSLAGIADSLTIRLTELQALQKSYREERAFDPPRWVQGDCLATAAAAIDIFNRAVRQEGHQWALLFDEMELAPTTIVESLLNAMRGLPENLLLKLSISPVQPELLVLNLPFSGVHGQDFDLIQLTYARQNHAIDLGKQMLKAELNRRNVQNTSQANLLGRSVFASFDEGNGGRDRSEMSSRGNPYAPKGELWKRYKSLAAIDPSFRAWLMEKDVDLDSLEKLSPMARAATLRKIRNLVVVRENYRNSQAARRSRKSYTLYTGLDTIVTICDGNPRLLTALTGQLFSGVTPTTRSISRSVQSAAIDSVIARFFALINSAEAVTIKNGKVATLSELVHRIGEAFAARVVEGDFSDNVPLKFTVDRGISNASIDLLRIGINMGVFVHIPKRSDARVPLDLYGEQFRMNYVLAPYFGLPVRLGPAIRLSSLVSIQRDVPRKHGQESGQLGTDYEQYVLFIEPTA